MKPFKINRNSWHYWLNQHMLNQNEYHMEKWEAKHSNFCSYWRATLFRVVWSVICGVVLLTMLGMMLVAVYMNPLQALYVVLVAAAIIASIIGCVLANEYFEDRKEANLEPKTLIGKQYAAYKSKICPSVEFQ